MRMSGLGEIGDLGSTSYYFLSSYPDSPSCGPNPCTWFDNVYTSQGCIDWMVCANPNDPTTIGLTQGPFAAAGAQAGQAVSDATGQFVKNLTPTGLGFTGLGVALAVGLGALVLIEVLKK